MIPLRLDGTRRQVESWYSLVVNAGHERVFGSHHHVFEAGKGPSAKWVGQVLALRLHSRALLTWEPLNDQVSGESSCESTYSARLGSDVWYGTHSVPRLFSRLQEAGFVNLSAESCRDLTIGVNLLAAEAPFTLVAVSVAIAMLECATLELKYAG